MRARLMRFAMPAAGLLVTVLLNPLPATGAELIAGAPKAPLTAVQLGELRQIGARLGSGHPIGEVEGAWKAFVQRNGATLDVDAAVQAVVNEAQREAGRPVREARAKAERLRAMWKALAAERNRLRASLAGVREPKARAQYDEKLRDMEAKLNSIGDDAQLANIDLQNKMQQEQRTFQTISNIMKTLHDTAKAIIRNIRG